jgi:hypothetical protein
MHFVVLVVDIKGVRFMYIIQKRSCFACEPRSFDGIGMLFLQRLL